MNNASRKEVDSKGGVLGNSTNRTCDLWNPDVIHLRRRGQLVQHINRPSGRDEWRNEPKNIAPYHSFLLFSLLRYLPISPPPSFFS